jgi:CHAT domain-containing protein
MRDPEVLASAFLTAFRARNEASMRKAAFTPEVDLFSAADALLGRHVQGSLHRPPEPRDFLECAAALAERARERRGMEALPGLVAEWRALGAGDLEREARLREALRRVTEATLKAAWKQALDESQGSMRDTREARASLAGIQLRYLAGFALRWLGRMEEARELFLESGTAAERIGWKRGRAEVSTELALAFLHGGRLAEARESAAAALRTFEEIRFPVRSAIARKRLGGILSQQGEVAPALEHLERAQVELRELKYFAEAARALGQIGTVRRLEGRYHEALQTLEAAHRELAKLGEREDAAYVQAELAAVLRKLGEPSRALRLLENALEGPDPIREPEVRARVEAELGILYGWLGEHAVALEHRQRAVRAYRALGQRVQQAEAQASLAAGHRALGDLAQAIECQQQACEWSEKAGAARAAALQRAALGEMLNARGDPAQALECLEKAHGWLARTDRWTAASVLGRIGSLRFELGREAEGLAALERARREQEELGDRRGAGDTLLLLARAHLRQDRPAQALEAARAGVGAQVYFARGLGEEEAPGPRGELRDGADLGVRAALLAGAGGSPAEAFPFMEAGRATLLQSLLVNRSVLLRARLPDALVRALESAQDRLSASERRLARLASEDRPSGAATREARREMDAAHEELRRVGDRARREARSVSDLVHPEPVPLSRLQEVLAQETLVLYHVTTERIAALAVGRGTARLFDLGSTAELLPTVETYVRRVSRSGEWDGEPESARELYDRLLRPLEPALGTVPRLVLSPDQQLAWLPFEALLRDGGETRERAIERWEIRYVSSAAVHVALLDQARERTRGRGLLALGDPVYPAEGEGAPAAGRPRGFGRLERLTESAREVERIGEMFPEGERTVLLREQASATALRTALARAREPWAAVHLAAHGFVDPEWPRSTGLCLGGGEILGLDDLFGLEVPADLAVLSACGTGLGRLQRGEGVLGLTRAFLAAGCLRVVVSNWKVDDDRTRDFMVAFHSRMRKDGLPAAAALRETKRAALRSGGAAAQPSAWAAFVLWGLGD